MLQVFLQKKTRDQAYGMLGLMELEARNGLWKCARCSVPGFWKCSVFYVHYVQHMLCFAEAVDATSSESG